MVLLGLACGYRESGTAAVVGRFAGRRLIWVGWSALNPAVTSPATRKPVVTAATPARTAVGGSDPGGVADRFSWHGGTPSPAAPLVRRRRRRFSSPAPAEPAPTPAVNAQAPSPLLVSIGPGRWRSVRGRWGPTWWSSPQWWQAAAAERGARRRPLRLRRRAPRRWTGRGGASGSQGVGPGGGGGVHHPAGGDFGAGHRLVVHGGAGFRGAGGQAGGGRGGAGDRTSGRVGDGHGLKGDVAGVGHHEGVGDGVADFGGVLVGGWVDAWPTFRIDTVGSAASASTVAVEGFEVGRSQALGVGAGRGGGVDHLPGVDVSLGHLVGVFGGAGLRGARGQAGRGRGGAGDGASGRIGDGDRCEGDVADVGDGVGVGDGVADLGRCPGRRPG